MHPASKIAVQFKEQRRLWYRPLIERLAARNPTPGGDYFKPMQLA